MTTLASELLDRAATIVLDETNVRWPLAELLKWLNDAQREVVLQKPSALSETVAIPLQAGTYQQLPQQYLSLLRINRNLSSAPGVTPRIGGRSLRVVSREVLDTQSPEWSNPTVTPYAREAKHYLFDEQDPMSFHVYPGNNGTGVVEAIVALNPQPITIATGADPLKLDSYAQPIALQDVYANAILDFMLYRAYAKDAQFAGNAQRAAMHYQQFANSLGIKVKVDMSISPNVQADTKAS